MLSGIVGRIAVLAAAAVALLGIAVVWFLGPWLLLLFAALAAFAVNLLGVTLLHREQDAVRPQPRFGTAVLYVAYGATPAYVLLLIVALWGLATHPA
jgi:hypothetical protein